MTESLERIQQRLESATDIHEIFGAMRVMAAVRLQEAQAALPGTRAYVDTVTRALAEVLMLCAQPSPALVRRPVLIAFMPEHGFVGTLIERLVERASERDDAAALVAVGDRGADHMEQRSIKLSARLPLGAHVQAGPPIARQLAATLDELIEREHADGVDVLFPRYSGSGRTELIERRLLPIDRQTLPRVVGGSLVNLPLPALEDAVLAEWVLGELVHATVETLASENGARLVAMNAARTSVESKLGELQGAYRIARQEAITNEIAEIAAGVLAQATP